MSYSRWNHSRWYTYATDYVDGEGFAIHDKYGVKHIFKASDLFDIKNIQLIEMLKPYDIKPTEEELHELICYINDWLLDPEREI